MLISREIQGDPIRYHPRKASVARESGESRLRLRDPGPHARGIACFSAAIGVPILVIVLMVAATTSARADDGDPPVEPPRALPYSGDLDGDRLLLGPVGAAVRIEAEWDTAFGATIGWLRLRERRALSAFGLAFGGARYSARDGGRLSLEGIFGTRRLGGVLIGATFGGVVELGDVQHPRGGVTGSAWVFAGVVPYVRAGWLDEADGFVEVGLAIALPVRRW
jgi:hypothetical protein